MGIIEQWGMGLQRMIRGCREYGVRKPEFIDVDVAFWVNFYRSKVETGTEMVEVELLSALSNTEKNSEPYFEGFRNYTR